MFRDLILALLILVLLDVVWLTAIAPTARRVFAGIQGTPLVIRWIPVAVTYLLMAVAIVVFAGTGSTVTDAGLKGALLGFLTYGVYDMTNYSTLTKYPLSFALSDMAWGTFLMGTTAAFVKFVGEM